MERFIRNFKEILQNKGIRVRLAVGMVIAMMIGSLLSLFGVLGSLESGGVFAYAILFAYSTFVFIRIVLDYDAPPPPPPVSLKTGVKLAVKHKNIIVHLCMCLLIAMIVGSVLCLVGVIETNREPATHYVTILGGLVTGYFFITTIRNSGE